MMRVCSIAIMLAAAMCLWPAFAGPQRPRDPWVFRCVLDQKPRMVVIALHQDLWAAYDATTCSLYKVWQGSVKFDGAVYTAVHGPQPTSVGRALYLALADNPWRTIDQNPADASMRWKGYRVQNDRLTLLYETAGGAAIEEDVDALLEGDAAVGIRRTFRVVHTNANRAHAPNVKLLLTNAESSLARITIDEKSGHTATTRSTDASFDDLSWAVKGECEIRMYFDDLKGAKP